MDFNFHFYSIILYISAKLKSSTEKLYCPPAELVSNAECDHATKCNNHDMCVKTEKCCPSRCTDGRICTTAISMLKDRQVKEKQTEVVRNNTSINMLNKQNNSAPTFIWKYGNINVEEFDEIVNGKTYRDFDKNENSVDDGRQYNDYYKVESPSGYDDYMTMAIIEVRTRMITEEGKMNLIMIIMMMLFLSGDGEDSFRLYIVWLV